MRSSGETAVLETAPATPPAMKASTTGEVGMVATVKMLQATFPSILPVWQCNFRPVNIRSGLQNSRQTSSRVLKGYELMLRIYPALSLTCI